MGCLWFMSLGKKFTFFVCLVQLSARAALGGAAMKELIKGQAIPNDVIVDIVVEAIR